MCAHKTPNRPIETGLRKRASPVCLAAHGRRWADRVCTRTMTPRPAVVSDGRFPTGEGPS